MKWTLTWKPFAATRGTLLSSFLLSLNFMPREHEITLIVVKGINDNEDLLSPKYRLP